MTINRFYYLLDICCWQQVPSLSNVNIKYLLLKNMATNKELEKRIEILENEVQHLKAILQYQMRNKKK